MKNNNIFWLIIAGLLVFILTREGCNYYQNKSLASDLISYRDSTTQYKLKVADNDSLNASTNEALQLYTEKQIRELAEKNDADMKRLLAQFSNVLAVVKSNTTATVTDQYFYYQDTFKIPCNIKPIPVVIDSAHFKLNALIEQEKFKINFLELPDKENIVIGEKKTGFLRKQTFIDVTHSNPYINTNRINGYVIHDQKWWESKPVMFFSGIAAGVVTSIVTDKYLIKK